MSKEILVVLPARLKSTRLPGKMLELINGVPLIVASAKNASKSGFEVLVAADDDSIKKVCKDYNVNCVLTPNDCESGTDRLAFLSDKLNWNNKVIVNVQGDEPLLETNIITGVAEKLISLDTDMSTAAVPLANHEEWSNPNCVKVVANELGKVLYFSRAKVPFCRDGDLSEIPIGVYRHLGIYAYTGESLKKWSSLKPSMLEKIEKLEQWRALENNFTMSLLIANKTEAISVDTYEDLQKLRDRK